MAALAACSPNSFRTHAAAIPHPLDPLSEEETETAVQVLKTSGRLTRGTLISSITLREPPKDFVLRWTPPREFPREAEAVIYNRPSNLTGEARIDLRTRRITVWKAVPGAQPALTPEDAVLVSQIVQQDPAWQAAVRKRGIRNPSLVHVDAWSAGFFADPSAPADARIAMGLAYAGPLSANYIARPIEGLVAHVDMTHRRVYRLDDTGVVPVPRRSWEFDDRSIAALTGTREPAPKPLRVEEPRGPEFDLNGHEVRWRKWRFRFGVTPREGLVLHQVAWQDDARLRPVLYRASLSEMVVPYADPSPAWYFRNSFDAGELGMGRNVSSLDANAVPSNAVFIDALVVSADGQVYPVPHAAALYERDAGLLWKYGGEARKARELVLGSISNLGNYEYGFNWIFGEDGTLQMKVALTGIMTVKAVSGGVHSPFGHMVSPDLEAVHHQHFFNFRLDMDVDGAAGNAVLEMNTEPLPRDAENPQGNAFAMHTTPLRTELEARRNLDLGRSRRWLIVNREAKNALGEPTAWVLAPEDNALPYAAPDSWVRRRAAFLNAHFWVTPYAAEELYAAGDYPNQSRGGDGLARWTAANRSIEGRDIVVWYTLGVTHIPRPEDWPVMPVQYAGFRLMPAGFFSWNPALGVPRVN